MHHRASNMAAAFINATAKAEHKFGDLSKPKVDHWVARRVALNTERQGFAIITEYDRSPPKPVVRKTLTPFEVRGIEAGILDLVETATIEAAGPRMSIEDGEETL